jgi:outer membrane protein OmpU
MKKILLATTVLSMSAGFAAADVSVSGDARMGVVSSDSVTTFSSRARIKFSGSGTTDAGLSFGGSFRAKDATGAAEGVKGSVFISGAFGKISMGDVDSGDSAAVGQLASVGYTGLGSGNSISYAADGFDVFGLASSIKQSAPKASTLDDEGYGANSYYSLATTVTGGAAAKVLYTYSANGLSVNASAGQISNSGSHTSYALGVAYTTGGLTLAAGYGSNEWDFDSKVTHTYYYYDQNLGIVTDARTYTSDEFHPEGDVTDSSLSATYVMGATTLKAIYQDKEVSDNTDGYSMSATSMGMSVQHKIDTLTLTAFYVTTDLTDDIVSDGTSVSFARSGIGASYDLGGGASITGGVVNVEVPSLVGTTITDGDIDYGTLETTSYTAYDFGVNFSF